MAFEDANEVGPAGSESAPGMESGSRSKHEEPTPDLGSSADPGGSSADPGGSADPAGSTADVAGDSPGVDATPADKASPRLHALWAVAVSFYGWLSRPRVRLTVTGLVLLLIGGLVVTSSVWTLPLVIIGALMVVIAWVGYRLDGRFAIEWGDAGTQLEFRAKIKAAQPAQPALPQNSSGMHYLARTAEPEPEDAEVVEGEAHTVEIDVAELKALIAAAEVEDVEVAQTDATAQAKRNLRVADKG